MKITGADLFVKALKAEQTDTLFAYPGGYCIDLFHALYSQREIRLILPRHEQGLIHAADGYARTTGNTGVCLVTSGPGATNLVTGIATANYDGVPLVCFTGQVPTSLMGKHAFQEVDTAAIAKTICKYAVTVKKREDLAATIQKAFYLAKTGRPGPVVVDLPKDVQQALGSDCYPVNISGFPSHMPELPTEQVRRAMDLLNHARKPIFLVGGGVKTAKAEKEMALLAQRCNVPVVTTMMGKGAIPTSHPLYVGNLGIHGSYAANWAVSQCDFLLAIGTRLNDRVTGNIAGFAPNAAVAQIDIDPSALSRNIAADIPIAADAKAAITALLEQAKPLNIPAWRAKICGWKKEHPIVIKEEGLTPQMVLQAINEVFTTAVVVTDVGQNQLWATQFLELDENRQMLVPGGLGTMGYGLPAGIGAKIGNPRKDVVVISGDGGIQMNIQELAVAVAYELPIIICIFNNGYLGNVRQWQELFYGKCYSGTCIRYRKGCKEKCSSPSPDCPVYIPDFVKLAGSYGANGIRITEQGGIRPALEQAKRSAKMPTVLEFMIGRETNVMPIVPPGKCLGEMVVEY